MNNEETIKALQQLLKDAGYYTGAVDGDWGPNSKKAHQALLDHIEKGNVTMSTLDIAWSAKVSPEFVAEVKKLVVELGMTYPDAASDLMCCMAFETGETFSPSVKSPVSSATGLIQFMDATAKEMGTTTAALAKMSAEEQLRVYVRKYFMKYKGKLKNLGDIYMAILWPAGIGKPDDHVLWDTATRPKQYLANKGLDIDKDGDITRSECLKKINEKKVRGMDISRRRPLM